MTSNIVLPSLSSWAQSHVTALLQANTTEAFTEAYKEFLAADVEAIVVNGKKLTKAQFSTQLQAAKILEQTAEVKYNGVVEVQDPNEGAKAGDVGLFLNATIVEKDLVFGAPATEAVTISFNLKIIQDPTIKPPSTTLPVHGYFDPRRVSALTAVFTEKANPISPPIVLPVQPAASS